MQWFDNHNNTKQCDEHRLICFPALQRFDEHQFQRNKSSMGSNRKRR